ncbi:TetR family transcriptional regulator [Psychrobacillus psychrodurans]|jgi:TetR/AcrR family fatty acid metabolism transcriptional regulator|uniref:TetR/AcrR family transcriptional regulator n=1 Tax=Psychrobacillus TaxID=1221880 RepID=UPI0008DECF9C|nr:TetR/AcrR family transcriptional regulator [Psychrobacillus psychrodurans]MCK1996616.1 TetR family transcriptional regulator [Psychrobacillus psychrodurans]MCZ8542020.1 TetR family transcriptional regulator [Psychrobacillus psychrodurans]SFN00371.1 TetR/AcrR family transcriptional regulator, fatty acid metabolism regulator protein [Psychrobacillus psychrodurans]
MKKDKPKYKQIIDAAIIVIAENGYHQSQVSKIAKQAGVADGTIYLYFKNKEEILVSVFEEKMEIFADNLKEIIQQEISSSEKLYKMIENHFMVLSSDHHLATVTQLELRQANLALRLRINAVLRNYLVLLDTILKEGIEQGEFDHSIDIRLARQMVFGTIDETTTTWVMNEHKYDLVDLTSKVHRLLLNGVKV